MDRKRAIDKLELLQNIHIFHQRFPSFIEKHMNIYDNYDEIYEYYCILVFKWNAITLLKMIKNS